MRTSLGNRFLGNILGFVTILGASLGGNPLAANLFGIRSQELLDGAGGVLTGVDGPGDGLGRAMVVGDFNGDGRGDLAAFDLESAPSLPGPGAIHVVYGSPAGLSGADDQLWYEFDPDLPAIDRQAAASFGAALAVGDFNGDDYDDLAAGTPFRDIAGTVNAGWVLVIYGSSAGLQNVDPPARRFQIGSGGITGGSAGADDRMGWALAAGDFNANGIDDLAIGIPGKAVGASDGAGAVLVLYGLGSGLSSTDHLFFDQDSSDGGGPMLGTAAPEDRFGSSLAAGDFDGDGDDDLAIGVPQEDVTGGVGSNQGAVQVLYGAPILGLRHFGNQLWTELNVDTGGSAEPSDFFGTALAAGDLTGDGSDDLVIGTPGEDLEGGVTVFDAGEITVLYGGVGTGLSTFASGSYIESDFAVGGAVQTDDHFGAALAIGDWMDFPVDPAGKLDLAIGVPQDDVWNGFQTQGNAGSVITTRQNGVFLGGNTNTDRLWAQGFAGSAGALLPNQAYGTAIAAGDFDGDGHGDLAIGAPELDAAGGANAGAIYTLYGALFSDGFESHDASAWSVIVP